MNKKFDCVKMSRKLKEKINEKYGQNGLHEMVKNIKKAQNVSKKNNKELSYAWLDIFLTLKLKIPNQFCIVTYTFQHL